MFASEGREEIIKRLQEAAANFTGLVVRRLDPIKLETFQTKKFGQFSDDEFITSISEFTVQVSLDLRVNSQFKDSIEYFSVFTEAVSSSP